MAHLSAQQLHQGDQPCRAHPTLNPSPAERTKHLSGCGVQQTLSATLLVEYLEGACDTFRAELPRQDSADRGVGGAVSLLDAGPTNSEGSCCTISS